jgi:hypothetical protein
MTPCAPRQRLNMNTWLKAAGLIAAVTAFSSSISAQWPAYTPPGVPKPAAGKPDLTAPAPRTADGKSDLSGVWVNGGFGIAGGGRGRGGPPADGRGRAGGPPPEGRSGAAAADGRGRQGAAPTDGPPMANFGNVGAGFPDGLPFQPWAAELRKKRMSENSKDNPDALCLPMGFMQFHTHPQPRKIIQTPAVTTIIYEANYGLRTIFTDGRTLPGDDAQPFWYGYSVGKWEGDTFVVESRGFRDEGWLDIQGSPFTDQLKLTERFRRVNYGTLEIDVTVDDPKAYTKPWTVRVNQRLTPDQEIIEFVCLENDRFTSYLRGDFRTDPRGRK